MANDTEPAVRKYSYMSVVTYKILINESWTTY